MRIALVDDDAQLAQLMKLWLESAGYSCVYFSSGMEFMNALKRDSFDLVILDWVMPDLDGEQVLNWIRGNRHHDIPVIFSTQRSEEDDIAKILLQGADDYITKPLREKEFLARVAAVTRRAHVQDDGEILKQGDFSIDSSAHRVTYKGQQIRLTQKEFELVVFLFKNVGRLLSRGHILSSVWGHGAEFNTRTVDTHISRIRKKLALTQENGWKLSAIYHQGYRLEKLEDTGDVSRA